MTMIINFLPLNDRYIFSRRYNIDFLNLYKAYEIKMLYSTLNLLFRIMLESGEEMSLSPISPWLPMLMVTGGPNTGGALR